MKFSILLAVVLVAVLSPIANAAVPPLINLQGVLRDSTEQPVADGSYTVAITMYDAGVGGTALWAETTTVATARGLFSVQLGSLNPIPDSAFNGSDRWFAFKVGAEPELAARRQLVSIGFAYRVNSVDGAAGGNIRSKVSIGPGHVNTGTHAFVAGESNEVSGNWSTVGGGRLNTAGGQDAIVAGGVNNSATGQESVVGGGSGNHATAYRTFVGGGNGNRADSSYATVTGGAGNEARGIGATVNGGFGNFASDTGATVGGGSYNKARGVHSVVGGGGSAYAFDSNAALGPYSTVSGGKQNHATAQESAIAGGTFNTASGLASFVGGGASNLASGATSVVVGGLLDTASGHYSVVGGGENNTASGRWATVAGGWQNYAADTSATVAGGRQDSAFGSYSTIGGGIWNRAGRGGTVAGGIGNNASEEFSAIGGGTSNQATGQYATIGGGSGNVASGFMSMIPGGAGNTAGGIQSLAAGYGAQALHDGSFVWADRSVSGAFSSTADNQFLIHAAGGVGIGTNSPGAGLHVKGTGFPRAFGFFDTDASAQDAGLRFYEAGVPKSHVYHEAGTNTLNLYGENFSGISVNSIGRVGIATTAPAALLHVNGTAGNNTGVWSNLSDRRLKKDIEPMQNALETVNRLQPVTFRWKDAQKDAQFGRVRGLIAQDVEKVIPEWIKTDPDGYKRLEPIGVDALLIEAIKEQQLQIEELKLEVERLKSQSTQAQAGG